MTLVATPTGLYYPTPLVGLPVGATVGTAGTMDAAAEKVAFIGHCYIAGRPGSAKTISAAGGGSIAFYTSTVTFANGSTTLDIGIQDVDITTGVPARPDDSFDVKRTLTGGTDTITSSVWNSFAMTGGTGSKSITHGDLIAVVFDMTARGGTDSVIIRGASATSHLPGTLVNTTGTWTVAGVIPMVMITFDDGTLAYLDGGQLFYLTATESYADATNPDERGLIFQVPWDCKIDAFWAQIGGSANTADFNWVLYSDPLGTPSAVTTLSIVAESLRATGDVRFYLRPLTSEISLTKDTNYVLAMKATGAGNVQLFSQTLPSADARQLLPGSTTVAKVTRNDASGAFSTTTTVVYQMGVRISQLHDTGGGTANLLRGKLG